MSLHCLSWLSGVLVLGLAALPAQSQEFSRGQALYENHCQSCHTDWAHNREGRKVDSVNELRRRVAAWSDHGGLGWSDEDIGDVADYLNRTFYRLEARP
jgi:mono/diheme cytochrome c family protein